MRKLLVVVVALAVVAGGLGAAPERADAACFTAGCFNKQIRKLKRQVRTLRTRVNALFACERVVPVTSYFGYDYQGVTNATSALDYTDPGDPIHAWVVVDICQTETVARSAASVLDHGLLRPLFPKEEPIERDGP